ncbi:hypothetical protein EV193_107217 [Herbihabitans rhizosphaerae]|uniref:Secreted protein n=1 Tax=Herbihabitans rhizosphaerae TaxID=1872711 RepID=A0A4Q7KK06_9PSEU|nr:hypothetical protein [Herbihabitans rhizosphaerae]RZS36536.1 hypothetical protein EV193_107217 [Herbihabitans rhizosphaerae]
MKTRDHIRPARIGAVIAGALLVALTATACGGDKVDEATKNMTTTNAPTTAQAGATSTGKAGTGSTGTSTPTEAPEPDVKDNDCVRIDRGAQNNAKITVLNCADPGAVLRIGTRVNGMFCPGELGVGDQSSNYVTYTVSTKYGSGSGAGIPKYKLCMYLNVKQGDCYTDNSTKTEVQIAKGACGPGANRVVKVAQQASEKACTGSGANGYLRYTTPPLTICVKK